MYVSHSRSLSHTHTYIHMTKSSLHMTSSVLDLRFSFRSFQHLTTDLGHHRNISSSLLCRGRWFVIRAFSSRAKNVRKATVADLTNEAASRFQHALSTTSLPPPIFLIRRQSGTNFAIGLSILAAMFVVAMRVYLVKKSRNKPLGTVADLVRRGQLRSDRRGISTPLKYEDPFNNPMVKVGNSNTTVEMCGKVYRLAPVTLTKELQAIHQKRRSRAYQWKRPTVFLKEGDPIPPDVDPETIRWIPANHPFASTTSDIDEDLAQNNVYQKHGVPFRIQAEHEALQKKLEALQSEEKLNKLVIDPVAAKDFGRPFKSNLRADDHVEPRLSNIHPGSKSSKSEHAANGNCPTSDDLPKT